MNYKNLEFWVLNSSIVELWATGFSICSSGGLLMEINIFAELNYLE